MILLHTTKYGDSSIILHGYTAESGRESYLLRGAGKKKDISIGCLHPLSILEIETSSGTKSSLKYVKEFVPQYRLNSLREDVFKSSIAIFISEVLYRSLLEGESDEKMYVFLTDSIITLNELERDYANFHLWFLSKYASILGYKPQGLLTEEFNPFSAEEFELLQRFNNEPFSETMCIPLNGEQRTSFATNAISYLEYHLGFKFEPKSLKILHRLCH